MGARRRLNGYGSAAGATHADSWSNVRLAFPRNEEENKQNREKQEGERPPDNSIPPFSPTHLHGGGSGRYRYGHHDQVFHALKTGLKKCSPPKRVLSILYLVGVSRGESRC